MDMLEIIKKRRSIRAFLRKRVEEEKIFKIIEAARFAPSSGNIQNWKFVIVKDDKKRLLLCEAALNQFWMFDAPVIIVVVSDDKVVTDKYPIRGKMYALANCSMAALNMCLEATSLGLGSCIVAAFDEEKIKSILKIPRNLRVYYLIPIGYPKEIPPSPIRKPIKSLIYIDEYGKNYEIKQEI